MLPQRNQKETCPVAGEQLRVARRFEALQVRIRSVEAILEEVVRGNSIEKGLTGAESWAFVGGILRDLLLAEPSLQLPIPIIAWNDIDVAVSKGDLSMSPEILQILESTVNRFGGRKSYSALLGSIDMWSWPSRESEDSLMAWTENLGKCDFGVNAVAYAWPLRNVIVHPQWVEDVSLAKKGTIYVETLHRTASEPIHAVRGIALKCRLAASHKSKQVAFGLEFRSLLDDLAGSRSMSMRDEMLEYTEYKIRQGKWSSEVAVEVNRVFGSS